MTDTPDTPDTRQRLASLMNSRRQELGLRWQDVAEAAGLSLKTLYSARMPGGGVIADRTRSKIDRGLRWRPGSANRILEENGDPDPEPDRGHLTAVPAPPDADEFSGDLDDSVIELLIEQTPAPDRDTLASLWRLEHLPRTKRLQIIRLVLKDRPAEGLNPARQGEAG